MQKKETKKKKPGVNGIDMGERGIYDKRNKLNDLTGKEWVYFTNSVWITGYSPTAKDNVGLKIRKIHPSPKPPGLIKDIIEFFTKSDGKILDPFVGVGGTLLGAALANGNRVGVGIELEKKYIEAYKKVCETENMREMTIIHDDARNMFSHPEIESDMFDLIIADPPYSDMMARERTGTHKKLYNDGSAKPYTNKATDLGNESYEEFLPDLKDIMGKAFSRLKDGGYMVVFCKDFQPQPGEPNLLHADIIYKLCEIDNCIYRGMRIWHDQAMSLYPFGYPYSFVMNQIHQYILIFRKEK
ncbi:DNA methyltransferase [Sporanaerobacter sp. PP17-6a]|uniref:DNA methyltransferase n=1 Tax=Sporanaerobacter sp. PP17-6a TaxID=1891289 RepID=UPI00089FC123|nr:DNA methyltransferase [Sporanaerobacter sp. PP17-6a]SCL85609.1 Modification methylase DpnIIB [Sporanaerobacter sp. PP17-6a]